jgi:hypothetical protein
MDEALTRLGMPVPDSALARRARELIADVAGPFLVNVDQVSRKPTSLATEMAARGILEEISQAPFDS